MKRIALLALLLALALCLTGCGGFVSILPGTVIDSSAPAAESAETGEAGEAAFEARPVLTLLGLGSFAESYYDETPVGLSYQPTKQDGTVGCCATVFDRASIIAACDALRGMTATARSGETPVSRKTYTLTMANGHEYSFDFGFLEDGVTPVLCTDRGVYTIEGGEALFGIEFPAYSSSFDIFDLYFDDAVRAFADGFYEQTPVSVGYRMNSGASITSTDPEAVEAAFRALADSTVIVVENQPDQNVDLNQTRDYIFTMEDGSAYTFSFAQRCLAVTANKDFGPVYYWITGTDDLWSVTIQSENSNGAFEGGELAGLREDIRRAAAIAKGEYEADLSVSGVFVEYSIGEESGYMALEGDTAVTFVKNVCALQVTADTEEAPEGDRFTISITLSDSSGPILYFTGDTIQQVVGINYVCDSAGIAALRDEILELAENGEYAVEVEDSGTQ